MLLLVQAHLVLLVQVLVVQVLQVLLMELLLQEQVVVVDHLIMVLDRVEQVEQVVEDKEIYHKVVVHKQEQLIQVVVVEVIIMVHLKAVQE
tara:strand:- start:26 stop:298 length:273 start_codon:yes stop_codon:yes gene_type:complete